MDIRPLFAFFSLIFYFLLIVGQKKQVFVESLPVSQQKSGSNDQKSEEIEKKIESEIDDLGLEYGRYLQQVVEALEQDKEFAKKLENVSQEEIKNGAIARELNLVDHNVRNKLDELKRIELERLRALAKKQHQMEMMAENEDNNDADHVNHLNPHSFEAEDLQKLILKATKDLEVLDQKRREDFKRYEMEKEIRFRESVVNMTDGEREERVKEHQREREHQQEGHQRVHHPGSKKQLEEVWEERDGMPAQEFDPKVFFQIHDINSDGFLDSEEVEAILSSEVKKLYSDSKTRDENEMKEEFHRMREHIYKEADINPRDGLISRKEFLEFTRRMEFERDDGWKGIPEEEQFSEEELKRYQQQRQQQRHHPQQQMNQQQYYYYDNDQHDRQRDHNQQQPNYIPVDQYIPPPQQMSPQEWHQLQQHYYQQQLHAQQQQHMPQHVQQGQQQYAQIPNAQLHAQQQQQQQYVQQHVPQYDPQHVAQQHVQQPPPMAQHVPMMASDHAPQMMAQHVPQQQPMVSEHAPQQHVQQQQQQQGVPIIRH